MKQKFMAAAAALAGAAGPVLAQQAAGISAADRLFVTRAADGNMAEMMTSQMALRKGQNAQIKTVAQKMIKEHGMAQDDLMKLAGQKSIALPPALGPTHQIVSMQLAKDSGSKFDMDYIGAQVEDHENTIALFQQEIASGQDADIKAYASQYLPKIVGHTSMIYGTASGLGVMAMKFRPSAPPAAMQAMPMTGAAMGTTATGVIAVTPTP